MRDVSGNRSRPVMPPPDLLHLSVGLWNFRPLIRVVVRMKQLHGVSPRLEARVAGVLYLFSILLGVVAMIFNSRNMQAVGDQTNLVAGVLYTGVTVLFWGPVPASERVAFNGCRDIQPGGLLASPVLVQSGAHHQLPVFRRLLPPNRLLDLAVAVSSKCDWSADGVRGCLLADHHLALVGPFDFAIHDDFGSGWRRNAHGISPGEGPG